GPAKIRIKKILRFYFPGNEFVGSRESTVGGRRLRLDGLAILSRRLGHTVLVFTLQIKTLSQADLNLIGITQNVAVVKADDLRKVAYAIGVAIYNARLDGMFHLPPRQCSIKDLAHGRRAQF